MRAFLLVPLLLPLGLTSPAPAPPSIFTPLYTPLPIPLEIHIMSQCPDALTCYSRLISPALSVLDPSHYTFTLSFIGRLLSSGEILCKHGQTECLGNMEHLCAAELADQKWSEYNKFSGCLLDNYEGVGERGVVEGCVEEQNATVTGGWGFEELNKCVSDYSGERGGVELLRKSVKRSEDAGVGVSCTVRLEGKTWCVHDGEWKDCGGLEGVGDEERVEALVREVERRFHEGEPGKGRAVEGELK